MSRRPGLAAAILSLALLGLPAVADPAATAAAPAPRDDMSLGSPHAPVTVIEYASLGCPHCGAWAREVFPAFKAKYVDTGKARFVLREMITGDGNLAMAGFLTARCAGPAHYFQVVDAVFQAEGQGAAADGKPPPTLLSIATDAGLTQASLSACLKDAAQVKAIEARATRAVEEDKVTGTPTFVIGGVKLDGEQSLAQLDAAIAAAAPHR